MKKLTLLTILSVAVLNGYGQGKSDTIRPQFGIFNDTLAIYSTATPYWLRSDTIPVLAYVCTDTKKAKFKWLKMYAVSQTWSGVLNMGNLKIYGEYLTANKSKSTYKVIYSLDR